MSQRGAKLEFFLVDDEYVAGDVIEGHVRFRVAGGETKLTQPIKVSFRGEESLGWEGGAGPSHSAELTKLELTLLDSDTVIEAGEYTYPFKIALDAKLPGSGSISDGTLRAGKTIKFNAAVIYTLCVNCACTEFGDLVETRTITLHTEQAAATTPKPGAVSEALPVLSKCCLPRGMCTMVMSMPDSVILTSATHIAVRVRIENQSPNRVNRVVLRLMRQLTVKWPHGGLCSSSHQDSATTTLCRSEFQSIPSQGSMEMDLPLQLSFVDVQKAINASLASLLALNTAHVTTVCWLQLDCEFATASAQSTRLPVEFYTPFVSERVAAMSRVAIKLDDIVPVSTQPEELVRAGEIVDTK